MSVFFLGSGRSSCSRVDGLRWARGEEAGDAASAMWAERGGWNRNAVTDRHEQDVRGEETCGIVDVIYLYYSASQKWVRKREDRGLPGISRMGRDTTIAYCGAEDKGSRRGWGDPNPGLRPVGFRCLPGSKQGWTVPGADRKSELIIALAWVPDKIPEDTSWHRRRNYTSYCLFTAVF